MIDWLVLTSSGKYFMPQPTALEGSMLTIIPLRCLNNEWNEGYFFLFQDITGWGENDRGVSYTFGGDVVLDFLKKHNLTLIARAHQVLLEVYAPNLILCYVYVLDGSLNF